MLRFGWVAALVLCLASPAYAQLDPMPADPGAPVDPPPPLDPDRVPGPDGTSPGFVPTGIRAPIAVVEGDGIKIGEGTALYPTIGLDTGIVSNVFFEENSPVPAGFLRLMAGVGAGSLTKRRLTSPDGQATSLGASQHRAELRLAYDLYLSGNDYVSSQNGLGIAATFRGIVGPQQRWSFLYLDTFERIIRATNFESTAQLNRDINRLFLGVRFAPPGRSMSAMLRYTNTLDLFESDADHFADRLQNTVGLSAAWRFRPVTVISADVSQGFYFGIGSPSMLANAKANSYPLTVSAALQTLLTLKTTLIARIGYTNGFYSVGPSYSNVLGGVQLGYRYSPLGRVSAMYEYRHEDSINSNYFRDHVIQASLDQNIVPFVLSIAPELHFRRYNGIQTLIPGIPDTRDDVIFAAAASLQYFFRNSIAAVAQYRFSTVQTDYMYTLDGETDDPSYVRHELIVGLRAAL